MSKEHKIFEKHGDVLYVDEEAGTFDVHLEDAVGAAYIAKVTKEQLALIGERFIEIAGEK